MNLFVNAYIALMEMVAFVLCSWARHFTLTVPLFTQVYKG